MLANEWITIKEATRILGISERTLWRRVKAGKYQTRREGGGEKALRLLSRKDIERDLKRSVSLPAPAREDKTIQLVSEFQNVIRRHTDKILAATDKQADKRHKRLFRNILLLLIFITILLLTFVYLTVTRESGRSESRLSDKIQTMADRQDAQNKVQEVLKTVIKNDLTQAGEQIRDLAAADQATREALKADIQEIRTATRTDNRATGAIIKNQVAEISRTGDRVKAQAEKIEAQTEEIKELRIQMIELQAGIAEIRAAVTRPTPAPAATAPPDPEEPQQLNNSEIQ